MGVLHTTPLILMLTAAATVGAVGENPPSPSIVQPTESLPGAEGTVDRVSWIRPVDVTVPITVDNAFGDVHLRSSGPGGVLDLSAVVQQLGPEDARLDLIVEDAPDGLRVTVARTVKPGTGASPADRSRADLALLVPEGATLVVTTGAGSVESRGVQAALTVTTESGDVSIRQKIGGLRLRSASGDLVAFLEPGATTAAESFDTTTGAITVWLRDATDADVTLATSGTITTDFSLKIEHHDHAEPDKRAHAVLGAGGRPVTLTSRRGDVALRRLLPASGD